MKVLQVLPRLESGGVERGALEIASALVSEGFSSFVASSGGKLVDEIVKSGSSHFLMSCHSKNPITIIKNSFELFRIIKKYKIDIIHARSRAPAWSCMIAARFAKIRFITTFHGRYGTQNSLKILYNSVMARGDKIIAISNFIKNYILEYYGKYININDVITIHRGVDIKHFDPNSVSEERLLSAQKYINYDPRYTSILMPARMTRLKGHLYLLDILKNLKKFNWKCYMVGLCTPDHHKYLEEVKHRIKELALENNVFIYSNWHDMPALYKCIDVVVSTSSSPEAFGRTVLEGQAMGKIVLAGAHGGALELIDDGKNGFHMPITNHKAASAILESVFCISAEKRGDISREAINAASRYTLDSMCKKTLATYKSLSKIGK